MAVQKRYYGQAVDLLMKAAPNLSTPTRPKGRDEEISVRVVSDALRKRDYDSANYAIDHIKDGLIRAKAMIDLGQEFSRWNVQDRDQAVAILINALDLMEMTVPDPDSICRVGNTRYLLTMSKPTLTLDEFTARAIRTVNRIPAPGADAKAGTSERAEFVLKTLTRAMPCVAYLFRPVMDSTPRPDVALVDQIKIKEWRLAAKIQAEISRRYPENPPK